MSVDATNEVPAPPDEQAPDERTPDERVSDEQASDERTLELEAGLQRLGFAEFRPGQREAIETLLAEGQLLLVAPTGGGKSLTYQLPATLLPGTALVVSPLVSLMHDQVAALEARGVACTYLASTLDPAELSRRMARLRSGSLSLVYAAPERLVASGMRAALRGIELSLVAVDEAHCISEWGHDFRPEYLELGRLLEDLSPRRVLACTATATPVVRDEIVERLRLPAHTTQLVTGFARPNLALRAAELAAPRDAGGFVDEALREALGPPGSGCGAAIVYAPTRRTSEQEASRIERQGYACAAYHAGLEANERARVQDAFQAGELEVVVATNAFGMGIDRADVRAVVHLAPPGSIEAYYQEVGRAGRDGKQATGLLLVSPSDLPLRRSLIERDAEGEVARHKWGLFLELMRFVEGGSCRHDAILRYFGDDAETLSGCGLCDVCQRLESEAGDPEKDALVVRKALSAVARIHGRFGLGAAEKLLMAAADERIERAGLTATPTWGQLSHERSDWVQKLLRRCVAAGWVDFAGGDRPVAVLTEEGASVMKGERPARMLLPPRRPTPRPGGRAGPPAAGSRSGSRAGRSDEVFALDEDEQALFDALRQHRRTVSREEGVPPYVVASDRCLRELARVRPVDSEALLAVHGIGPAKAARYGEGLLEVIRRGGS